MRVAVTLVRGPGVSTTAPGCGLPVADYHMPDVGFGMPWLHPVDACEDMPE